MQSAEQRQPELLRRLLGHADEDAQEPTPAAPAKPLAAGAAAAAGTSRGRAQFGRLVSLMATLALAVLLLHFLRSNALHQQLQEPGLPGGLHLNGSSWPDAQQAWPHRKLGPAGAAPPRLRLRRCLTLLLLLPQGSGAAVPAGQLVVEEAWELSVSTS